MRISYDILLNSLRAHKLCEGWAKTHGAVFAPQKYELIHLTRTRRFNLNRSLELGTIVVRV